MFYKILSGVTYTIDTTIPSSVVVDENESFVKVNGNALDETKKYTIASIKYDLTECGDALTLFKDAELLRVNSSLDYEIIASYIRDTLKGEIPEKYSNPLGEGKITVI